MLFFSILNNLRACYERIFTRECDSEAGRVIGGLMHAVFEDPLYLRYQYRPDCVLHGINKVDANERPSADQPPPSTTPKAGGKDSRSSGSDNQDDYSNIKKDADETASKPQAGQSQLASHSAERDNLQSSNSASSFCLQTQWSVLCFICIVRSLLLNLR